MATVGAGAVAPDAGVSIELGLGRPTIKIGPPLSTQIGLVESEIRRAAALRSRTGTRTSTRSSTCWRARSTICSAGSGAARPRAPPCSSRPGQSMPSATPAAPGPAARRRPARRRRPDHRARRLPPRTVGEVHERHRSHYAHGQPGEQPPTPRGQPVPASAQTQQSTLMSGAPDVVVIGAGPAGLAAAAELGRMGIPTAVLEQAAASARRGAAAMTGSG